MPPLKAGYIVGAGGNIVSPAQQAIRNTAASTILNRANVREGRTPISNPSTATNANAREGRTSSGGIGSVTVYEPPPTKLPTNNNNFDTLPGPGNDPYVPPVYPVVAPPPPQPPTAKDLGVVKTPGRDVTKISDLVQQIPSDTIKRIAFEQLSAIELSQVLTSNTVDGVNQKYSIISNLSDIRKIFNASKQLSIMNKLSPMTGVFTIDIESKIPSRSYILNNNLNTTYSYIDENGDEITVEKGYIYVDTNGDIVIEFENIKSDEIAQIQINADGTIYEVT
jgi:hypothetical protein